MSNIYLISGMGADSRLFKNINIQGHYIKAIDWVISSPDNTLSSYGKNIIDQYNIEAGSIIIGVSLGGMIAVEIAKQIKLNKVILISSIKLDTEKPWFFKLFKLLPIYKIVPNKLITKVGFLIRPIFGKMVPDDLNLFKKMLRDSSPIFLKWAMKAVLQWRNSIHFSNLYHIVGDKDLVFPYKNIKDPTAIVKGGTHIMIFDKANEINNILADILRIHETA